MHILQNQEGHKALYKWLRVDEVSVEPFWSTIIKSIIAISDQWTDELYTNL